MGDSSSLDALKDINCFWLIPSKRKGLLIGFLQKIALKKAFVLAAACDHNAQALRKSALSGFGIVYVAAFVVFY